MTSEFTQSANIDLLWEIIYDMHFNDNKIDIRDPNTSLHFKTEFITKINDFVKNIKSNGRYNDLVSLNKDFILTYVNTLNNNIKVVEQEPVLISIEDIESYRTDNRIDIQSARITNFEKELKLKQHDFEDFMKIKSPDVPNFADGELDKPIGEMEELIARTLAQRNFEIEQIHNKNLNPEEAEKWLYPQETSVKSEKVTKKNKPLSDDNKRVTWNDNITFEIKEKNSVVPNIFSKLKIHLPEEETIIFEKEPEPELELELNPEKEIQGQTQGQVSIKEQAKSQAEIKIIKEEIDKINNKLDDITDLLLSILKK
uniref:Uncharacterized protein n=1 Tax=viral metagenome TaxID=1070528 RepID=A0A6C0KVU1_9ZZZZ